MAAIKIQLKLPSKCQKNNPVARPALHNNTSVRPLSRYRLETVKIRQPDRISKLSPKFSDPCSVVRQLHGNKFEVHDPLLNTAEIIHIDRLVKTNAQINSSSEITAPNQVTNQNTNKTFLEAQVQPTLT